MSTSAAHAANAIDNRDTRADVASELGSLLDLWANATETVIAHGGVTAMLARLEDLLPDTAPSSEQLDQALSQSEMELAAVMTALKSFDRRLRSAAEIQSHDGAKAIVRRWMDEARARRKDNA